MWILKTRELFHSYWTWRKTEMVFLSPFQVILSSALGLWSWKDTCWFFPKSPHRWETLNISKTKFKHSDKKSESLVFLVGGSHMNFYQITQHILPRAEWERSIYVVKLHILPESDTDDSLHTLKEFPVLEFTALHAEIDCS